MADRDIALTASVGVAFADDDVSSADLIRNADVAMARAKELGGRRVEVFAAHMHADVVRRLELAADLQRALLENQFAIEYQPVVDLATSRVTAVEALVRWVRGGTFVPPEQFLGPAEDTGLIVPLSEWILREACREVAAWRASSWDIGLSLNLSSRQIMAPRFVETVESALAESGLPPSALTLEVIEEMLVEDAEETITRLSELRRLGVRLAIDDFGTGYASLAFLRQLPVDMIKIDPSFVSGLGRRRDADAADPDDRAARPRPGPDRGRRGHRAAGAAGAAAGDGLHPRPGLPGGAADGRARRRRPDAYQPLQPAQQRLTAPSATRMIVARNTTFVPDSSGLGVGTGGG